jgi:hypothetical protein
MVIRDMSVLEVEPDGNKGPRRYWKCLCASHDDCRRGAARDVFMDEDPISETDDKGGWSYYHRKILIFENFSAVTFCSKCARALTFERIRVR